MASALQIRPAEPSEAAALSALALRSKAHWGYDAEFLERVRPVLTFSESELAGAHAFVLVPERDAPGDSQDPIGMYIVSGTPPEGELEHLWLDPEYIGAGNGARLIAHARATAAALGLESLLIEADPNAQGFYEAIGAVQIGTRYSESGRRTLPLLRLITAATPAQPQP